MKVLVVHNRYRHAGGEDLVAHAETQLLRAHGVDAVLHQADNDTDASPLEQARLALGAAWSKASYDTMRDICERVRPDVVHVHNFWMRLSPSIHSACHAAGAATVQTLHNFRLLCPNGLFLRHGKICEDCLGTAPWRGVVRRCYHDSVLASTAVAGMIVRNRWRGTWHDDVDAFITPSEHARSKFIADQLPADRVFVKPNSSDDPGDAPRPPSACDVVLYAGRLSEEKGLGVLLAAWKAAHAGRAGRLVLAGDGPAGDALQSHAASLGLRAPDVVFTGWKNQQQLRALLATARCVVLPSLCFETFGNTIVEAFAHRRPVIVSDIGAPAEIVRCGSTGLKVPPADEAALAEALTTMLADGSLVDRLGASARNEYLARFTHEINFNRLMSIYQFALAWNSANATQRSARASEPSRRRSQARTGRHVVNT